MPLFNIKFPKACIYETFKILSFPFNMIFFQHDFSCHIIYEPFMRSYVSKKKNGHFSSINSYDDTQYHFMDIYIHKICLNFSLNPNNACACNEFCYNVHEFIIIIHT